MPERKANGQKVTRRKVKVQLPRIPKGLTNSEKSNKVIKLLNKKMGGNQDARPENIDNLLFLDARLSTQPNTDSTFMEYGVIHLCDSVAVNALRELATSVANFFGQSGFDSTLYDLARKNCLTRIANILNLKNSQLMSQGTYMDLKVCNLRFEMLSGDPSLITINAYGTLLGRYQNQAK